MPDTKPDYKITKLEKGPLQRFKNQNLLLKKFGEVGLQMYKVITGKRTANELRKDLDIEEDMFFKILDYMKEAGMIELVSKGEIEAPKEEKEEVVEEKIKPAKIEENEKPKEENKDDELEEQEITPLETEIIPIEMESEERTEEKEKSDESKKEIAEEEQPIEEPEKTNEEPPKDENEEIDLGQLEPEEHKAEEGDELSPVERIIKNKYGDVGITVYHLIDGQRTAEEIMKETGLTESKLVEVLDFMDEQGIIKLEYPKDKQKQKLTEEEKVESIKEGFVPMLEGEDENADVRKDSSPVELPIRMPSDIIKSVQLKAKILIKFGDRGAKVMTEIDGKKDVLDLALALNVPLYELYEILRFIMGTGAIMLSPLSRTDVKKKYGDDGFAVYKKYGREGLLLYELISKEMTLKQMADRITKDKEKVIEMFIFIHQVLGIDLPIDKEVLRKQLGA
ncbi:MAG: hypothetical protein Q7S22_05760 [Candidatus Micrarchaeota archaeon]|nr:hypothetical protein [Candidatus Micrarchaeota archaeon]